MTTDKTSSAADTFKENANNGIKWFQNANATFIETQNKQLKVANDIYNKMMHTAQSSGKPNMDFGASGKTIMETMQKNIEKFSGISKEAMKTITDMGKKTDIDNVSKEAKQVFDVYNKQVEELTKLNQQSFDAIVKQFDTTKSSFSPITENFKKELDSIIDNSKESIQTTMNSYTQFAASSVEANKEVFDKFIGQMNDGITANIKAWKDLMNLSVANKEGEKHSSEPKAILNGSSAKKHGHSK
jgi:DNA anti-recombination protein RmuC